MRNFMDLSRALKGLADAFHTIKLKLDGLYDSAGAIGYNFELIEDITVDEEVAYVLFDNLHLSEVALQVVHPIDTEAKSASISIKDSTDNYIITTSVATVTSTTSIRYFNCMLHSVKGLFVFERTIPQNVPYGSGTPATNADFLTYDHIATVSYAMTNILPGTQIKLYGIPA